MADDKTHADEAHLLDLLEAMILTGKDGVEAGLSTTEFWLVAIALVIDLEGPSIGFLQGIDANEQGVIAAALVLGWTWLRSWRKRGGPAKAFADILALLHGVANPGPPDPAAPAEAKAA